MPGVAEPQGRGIQVMREIFPPKPIDQRDPMTPAQLNDITGYLFGIEITLVCIAGLLALLAGTIIRRSRR